MQDNIELPLLDKKKNLKKVSFGHDPSDKYLDIEPPPHNKYRKEPSFFRYNLFLDMLDVSRYINSLKKPLKQEDLPAPYEDFNPLRTKYINSEFQFLDQEQRDDSLEIQVSCL